MEASAGQVVQNDVRVRPLGVRVTAALVLVHHRSLAFGEAVKGQSGVTEVVKSQHRKWSSTQTAAGTF